MSLQHYKAILKEITPPLLSRNLSAVVKSFSPEPELPPLGSEVIAQNRSRIRGIFMHIHKCAGTSLIHIFETIPEVISCAARPGNFPARTGWEAIPQDIQQQAYKFTFVRNPYARIVSAYRMFIKTEIWKSLFPTFDDFVEFLQWSDVHHHTVTEDIPMEQFIHTIGNAIHHCSSFHNPKYRLEEMDYIGRVETLAEDIQQITNALQIEPIAVPHLRKAGANQDYRSYYSARTKAIIGKIYQADLERFDYQF